MKLTRHRPAHSVVSAGHLNPGRKREKMATVTKAVAKKNGTYKAPAIKRPDGWLPHFIRVVLEGK
jgi:hypothetical protein